MRPFAYARPKRMKEAFDLLAAGGCPKGGGYDLLDLAKGGHPTPSILVDMRGIEEGRMSFKVIVAADAHLEIGCTTTLADLVASPELGKVSPVLADAAASAATPQVRNVATVAGNLLQRPRCPYFRDLYFDCLKRGGRTCPAMEGDHGEGAVFGNSKCCATHPSNLATALLAMDAVLHLRSLRRGEVDVGKMDMRTIRAAEFFVTPEEDPSRENRLQPGEVIAAITSDHCPASAYVEVDQKQSFDWASASAAVALQMEGAKVKSARVALGAVAPVPLLSEAAAKALEGKVPDEKAAEAASEAAVKGATPLRDNGHKVQHLRVCVKRAVLKAAERGRR